ncbi:succinate dehydrogenase cytochrome b558 subunit [Mechercharimyces sp. CAU 1602]|uniref:succinate dehydrogenase cytochrome b558 subunit n=1 Tax=Mechercharimyces sp. CAU 1602 TaxID=2973933 RepID=UPI00216195B8|nr:succinate dehydrogenase cytochrome b558 subunit [Mechercharimyces sp. CAU 1602]MCS1351525.1 succinate dehydrogenase cytochrome b558 subunit [Mechercharimyces sp. CAU 1602]
MSKQVSFFSRRLHSLLGVIPVGFFLVEHLLTNWYATRGADVFVEKVNSLWEIPFLWVFEVFFIFLPLLYHGVYGLYIAFTAKNNVTNYGYFRNVMFMLQRVTGVITLVFVSWHVWETRIQLLLQGFTASELAGHTAELLSNDLTFILYIIGLIAAVFHFSNGMWSFLVSWGITVGPRSQRVSTFVWIAVFFVVSYLGVSALFAFVDPEFTKQLAQR